jgi:hypothetical protein
MRPNDYPVAYSNAEKSQDMLSFFCMHIWHFTYDIKFPVKVTIVDEETIKNDEYSFIFAFKGSIDHNQAKRDRFNVKDFTVENFVEDEEFCNDHYNSVRFYAMENTSNGLEIKDVNLSLVCGKFKCDLGLTKPDYAAAGTPYWEGMTPYCTLGILKGKKEGYLEAETFVQTDSDDRTYYLYMDPVKEFRNVTVVKHKYSGGITFPSEGLADGESAIIMLKVKSKDFERSTIYTTNETIKDSEEALKLLSNDDYTYDVEIYIMNDDEILGGYKAEWSPEEEDVDKARRIKFHVLYGDFKDDTEMALFFSGLEEYSNTVLKPELVR